MHIRMPRMRRLEILTWSMERMGVGMRGPDPLMTSNSIPIEGRGVKMSENMMTPSVPKALRRCVA